MKRLVRRERERLQARGPRGLLASHTPEQSKERETRNFYFHAVLLVSPKACAMQLPSS